MDKSRLVEHIKLTQDSELESFFSTDGYVELWNTIRNYPVLEKQENEKLILEVQNGAQELYEKAVKSNLRLVLFVVKKYISRIQHLQMLDIFQEGVIALIESIYRYNPEKGAFSTIAIKRIDQCIRRAVENKEKTIRNPVYFESLNWKYQKFLEDYENNGKSCSSDEKLCELLNITKETLYTLKESKNLIPISINQKENDEDNNLELFIGENDNSYNDVLNDIDNTRLFIVLKEILRPVEYYILYYHILTSEKKSFEDIGKTLGKSRQRTKQIYDRALEKIKPYLTEESREFKKKITQLLSQEKNIKAYNIMPIEINLIIIYHYIKSELSPIENIIMYYQIYGKYKIEWYIRKLNLTEDEYSKLCESLKIKVQKINSHTNRKKFKRFKINLIKCKGATLLDLPLEEIKEDIDFQSIKDMYGNLTYEEIINLFRENNIELNNNEIKLLKKFYKTSLEKKEILKTFLNNIKEFNEEQILFLECYYFKLKTTSIFDNTYPESNLYKSHKYLIERLERIHYNITIMYQNSFTKEKYIFIKNKYFRKLTPERIELLDLYYGIKGKSYTVQEIAKMYNEDYIKIHDKIKCARELCISLYNNKTRTLTSDLGVYKEYVIDEKFKLTEETRKILKMFIIDNLEYSDISKLTGLSNYRISNIISEGIRKIDFYRYHLIETTEITPEELIIFYNINFDKFSDLEQEIIKLKKINGLDNEEIAKKLMIKKEKLKKVIEKFNILYKKFKTKDIKIFEADIILEINYHISESILDDLSKEILSLFYGFKTSFNNSGTKLSASEIMKKLNLSKDQYYKKISSAIDKLKEKKAEILKPDLLYISRSSLEEILNDIHLPITKKERDIICYLFELKGYPYKSLEELSIFFEENKDSIKRRYKRSILNIYKYLNKEIEGILDYEIDIEPNLKYFSKSDALFIEEYFKNNLTYESLSDKYDITYEQVVNKISRLYNTLKDIISADTIRRFDFEFYRKEKNNPNLPFYGNRNLATTIFDLFYGEINIQRFTVPEIITKLNLDYGKTTILEFLSNFMISFCKLKEKLENPKIVEKDDYIFLDLLKERYPKIFNLVNINHNGIDMNGKQLNHVYRILNRLERKREKYKEKYILKRIKEI